jgi:hypothetical protein
MFEHRTTKKSQKVKALLVESSSVFPITEFCGYFTESLYVLL